MGSSILGEGADINNRVRLATGLEGSIRAEANQPWIAFHNTQATLESSLVLDSLRGFHAKSPSLKLIEHGDNLLGMYGGHVKGMEQIFKEQRSELDRGAYAAFGAAVAGAAQQKRLQDAAVNTQYVGTLQVVSKDRELAAEIAKIGPYGSHSVRLTDFSARAFELPKAPGQLELIQQQFQANMEAARLHYTAEVFQGITRDMSRRLEDAIKAVTRY